MSIETPTFSVVCPVYNSEQYIAATLESVFTQTLLPTEIIIVDDGSTDDTVSVIENMMSQSDCDIKVIKSFHKGPGAARNLGVSKATSTWIAFIDSDDLWERNKLETISNTIVSNPVNNIFCHAEYHLHLDGSLKVVNYGSGYNYNKKLSIQLFSRNYFSTSATVCSKTLINEFGGFDESMMNAQDYDLWLKISPKATPLFIDDVLGVYRLRHGNITSGSIEKKTTNLLKIIFRYRVYVTKTEFFLKIIKMAASYLKQKLKRLTLIRVG